MGLRWRVCFPKAHLPGHRGPLRGPAACPSPGPLGEVGCVEPGSALEWSGALRVLARLPLGRGGEATPGLPPAISSAPTWGGWTAACRPPPGAGPRGGAAGWGPELLPMTQAAAFVPPVSWPASSPHTHTHTCTGTHTWSDQFHWASSQSVSARPVQTLRSCPRLGCPACELGGPAGPRPSLGWVHGGPPGGKQGRGARRDPLTSPAPRALPACGLSLSAL